MRKYLLFATAALALASCTNETYLGTAEELATTKGEQPISFGFDVPTPTRAEGAAAATKLNNRFIVYAEKNESGKDAPTTGNLVIKNYVVNYVTNSAYTSTSNTKDWEYVGFKFDDGTATIPTTSYSTNITPNSGSDVEQTIKYWDYAASNYVFTAVSANPADITSGAVKITKVTAGTTDEYDKGYTVTVTDMADLSSLYFADRVKIGDVAADKTGKDRTATNKYGGNVKFTFRNGVSQVRVGMYETIPGYQVKVTKFYYDADATTDAAKPAFSEMTDESTTNFVANVPSISPDVANSKTSVAGTFTVKYYEKNSANDAAGISNHPTISFTPTNDTDSKQYITLGDQIAAATKLGETSPQATFDKTSGAFTTVFPQETNNKNLKLKIDYQLSNTVTGEIINITGKTAEVPGKYLQWKPNFKYTYLFKITDDDLYPITFDAVVVEAENGNVEYITTVTEPSITTYARASAVTTNGEYAASEKVYAVVENGSSLATLSASNMKLYTVTTTDATNFPITEASVAEAIAEYPTLTTAERTAAKIKFTASSFNYGNTVVAEDGSTVTMGTNVVADFTTAASTVYAIEYIKTDATYSNDGGKTYADAAAFAAAGTLYSNAECTTEADDDYYSSHTGATYYKKTHVTAVGTYAYKIVRVAGATGEVTP